MRQSEQINELVTALAKAQGKITGALKDSENPFFKSKYADLASCWDAARDHLSANGLAVIQGTERGEPVSINWSTKNQKGDVTEFSVTGHELVIITKLMHSSGQWIESSLNLIPGEATPQGVGSCITYGRRYGLCAIIGIAQVDDDGNSSSMKGDYSGRPQGWKVQDTRKVTEYKDRILGLINEGKDLHAVDVWKEVKDDHDFATALWVVLPNPVKTMLKKAISEDGK